MEEVVKKVNDLNLTPPTPFQKSGEQAAVEKVLQPEK